MAMSFSFSYLLQWMMLMVLTFLTSCASSQVINSSCKPKCGNVDVPYPFGMSEGCYWSGDDNFFIRCDENESDPASLSTPYWGKTGNTEVVSISVDGEMSVYTRVSRDCYNNGTNVWGGENSSFMYEFPKNSFPFSNTRNKFTAVGCDTVGMFAAGAIFNGGCLSGCFPDGTVKDFRNIVNGSCFGLGCCQTSIPMGLRFYEVRMTSTYNYTMTPDGYQCGYAFLVDNLNFTFSGVDDLKDRGRTRVPTILDWSIGSVTCQEAVKNSSNYICKGSSQCVDVQNGSGYRCKCPDGYQGSGYLTDGCQDIDECQNNSLNKCVGNSAGCTNTEGSYTCPCPFGLQGDGFWNGTGCQSDRSLVIKFAVGASAGVVVVISILLFLCYWLYKFLKRRRTAMLKKQLFERNGGFLLRQQTTHSEDTVEKIKIFTSTELEKATDNYNLNRILGQGGQGTVYKGMLPDGMIVAVKKSKLVDESQLEPFINEVVILSQINHRNVVRLLGCCLETEVPLLIYEYIPNGSLYDLVHHNDREFLLSWRMRLQAATEVAGALAYLHSFSSVPIYHRDIKSSNILLDEKFRAKVSDFGTSRTISIDQTHLTTAVQGTFGYLDPEYFQTSQFTEKSDVYSFGVVLVELLTNRKAVSSDRSPEERSLATYFLSSLKDGRLFELVDAQVMQEGTEKEIMAVANIAKQCLDLSGKKRPHMKEVMVELEGIRMAQIPIVSVPPTKPQQPEVIVEVPSFRNDYSTHTFTDTSSENYHSAVHPLLLR